LARQVQWLRGQERALISSANVDDFCGQMCQKCARGRAMAQRCTVCASEGRPADVARAGGRSVLATTIVVSSIGGSQRKEEAAMKTSLRVLAVAFILLPAAARGDDRPLSPEKAEMMGRVEDFFLHNFRDVTWRKSLEWGDVRKLDDGARAIRYSYEALIWDKEHVVMNQEFTFAASGEFVSFENVKGFPQKKRARPVDVTTREGLMELVENFFANNYRDITARKMLEWGDPIKDKQGNTSIRCKYEAMMGNKEKRVIHQVFTFDPKGECVSIKAVEE
jgi:hypothetical protein